MKSPHSHGVKDTGRDFRGLKECWPFKNDKLMQEMCSAWPTPRSVTRTHETHCTSGGLKYQCWKREENLPNRKFKMYTTAPSQHLNECAFYRYASDQPPERVTAGWHTVHCPLVLTQIQVVFSQWLLSISWITWKAYDLTQQNSAITTINGWTLGNLNSTC